MGTLLPSLLRRFSEMTGIFHLLLDRASGEMDCEFKKRIEEKDDSTGVDSACGVEVGCGLLVELNNQHHLFESC